MMNGGNILVLQRLLGHTDIQNDYEIFSFRTGPFRKKQLNFNPLGAFK